MHGGNLEILLCNQGYTHSNGQNVSNTDDYTSPRQNSGIKYLPGSQPT